MPRQRPAEDEISLASVPVKDRGTILAPGKVLLLRMIATSPSFVLLYSISLGCTSPAARESSYPQTNGPFSAHIDITGVQALVDTRGELERWVDGPVEVRAT